MATKRRIIVNVKLYLESTLKTERVNDFECSRRKNLLNIVEWGLWLVDPAGMSGPSHDRQGVSMGRRPTKTNQGASGHCRVIDNWDRTFNSAFSAGIPETGNHARDPLPRPAFARVHQNPD